MLHDVLKQRFRELADQYGTIPFHSHGGGMSGSYAPSGTWQKWATSAQSLIKAAFGEHSPHYENFVKALNACTGSDFQVRALLAIFQSAKDDFDGGYVFNVELRVSGEVFGDFVALARQALTEGHKDVAAVLACAALEDCLKRYAMVNGLEVGDKVMQEVVNALKANGLVAGPQKTLLEAMPKIRDHAMHANWEKISPPDVSSVIGFVESFLLTKFSDG